MPSTTQYRISRTLPNGWQVRLDFIPYDCALNAPGNTTTELDAVCLLELGEQKAEFEAVPYGLCKPQTLKIKLAWSRLPSAMRTFMELSSSITAVQNLFILYSDRGTNGATWSVEFAGCEDNVEALELEPIGDGLYAYSIELVDMAYYTMKTTMGTDYSTGKKGELQVPNKTPWQMYLNALAGRNEFGDTTDLDLYASTSVNVMEHVAGRLGTNAAQLTNAALIFYEVPALFDITSTLRNMFTVALELYGCTTDGLSVGGKVRRKITPALTASQIYLTTNVVERTGGNTIGGIYARGDNYAWMRPEASMYDVMRDLCETLGVKASYRFSIIPNGTYTNQIADAVGITWDIKRIGSSRDYANNVDTADVTIDTDAALTQPKITKRGENVLKSEVRFETSNSEDKTEIVRVANGARASRSMNVEPIVHNIPVFLREYDERRGRWEPFKQTNLLYFQGNGSNGSPDGSIMKVHEDTLYWYGPGATHYVSVSSPASDNPYQQTDENQQFYMVQLASLQAQTSMAAALTKLHLKAFSDADNALVEIEYPMTASPYVLPSALAGRHVLTGTAASTFTTLAWTRALPVSISVDWTAGTSKMSYYLMKPTTAN
ncbi:MAG TPA: hypothetical protein DCZ59_04345 [Bacteroidetes bacterium]|nr:hypothetical protein [Bacteroidota bacterium]